MNEENAKKVIDLWKSVNIPDSKIKKKLQLEIVNQIASTFAIGQYYFMIFNLQKVDFEFIDDNIKNVLGMKSSEFNVQKMFELFHPDDLVMLHEKENFAKEFLYTKISKEEIPFYKVVYLVRFTDFNGGYKTILHQSRAINVSDDGKILQSLVVHSDVTFLDMPFNHKISFISQNHPSFFASEKEGKYSFNNKIDKLKFTSRETEIIEKIAEGKTYAEIAAELFLSKNTISFHRKNILRKSECNNSAQLIARCIREGII